MFVWGTTRIGADGRLLNHGTSNLKGAVTNHGLMALMNIALFQSDYSAEQAELRLPAVVNNYDGTSTGPDIPLLIKGASSGTSTVYTVDPADWQTLQTPQLGDNYILSLRDGDVPAQNTFLLAMTRPNRRACISSASTMRMAQRIITCGRWRGGSR